MNFKITILLITALLAVSTSPIVARMLDNVPAISISFWRMFIGAIVLWIVSMFVNQGKMQDKKNLFRTISAGILLGIHFLFFFTAIKLTFIANATFLGTLAPLFTLIFEILFLKRIFKIQIIVGLLIALTGAFVILFQDFNISANNTVGNLSAIACSIVLAVSFLIAEKVREKENTIVYTRTLYLSAALTLFILALIMGENLYNLTLNDCYGLIFLGIVPTILGHNAIYYSIKYVSPTIVAAFPIGEPVIATIFAYIIFSEIIGINIILGGIITFTGLILISVKKK